MSEYPTLAITDNGPYNPLCVRLLLPGTSEHKRVGLGSAEPLLEFFDLTSVATVYGQRICCHGLAAVADGKRSLNLCLGEPRWSLAAAARASVVAWAEAILRSADDTTD